MPANIPVAKTESPSNGLEFVTVLRDCLNSGIVVLDEQRKITAFNPHAEQFTGLNAAAISGKQADILPGPLLSLVSHTISTGQPSSQRQVVLRDAKGAEFAVLASTMPLGSNGKIGCVLILNDVSSFRKWEGNMRRLDRLHSVGTLSASMAHEIKNAFVAVRTFVDLLIEKNKETELAAMVRQEVGRIDSLVGQMLRLAGPARPALTSVSVHFALNKSLLLIQHLLDEKKIQVARAFNASPDLVDGDADQLQQAFLNLFFNALDAMENGGKLEVSTSILPAGASVDGIKLPGGQRHLKVVIRDSGVGIPAENRDRLYEPFFTTKPEGTGLGLAITRRIIQEHHGIISFQSELNKGTAFSLILPAPEA